MPGMTAPRSTAIRSRCNRYLRASHPRRSPPRGCLFRGFGRWVAHRWLLHLGLGKPPAGRSSGQHRQETAALSDRASRSDGPLGCRSGFQEPGLGGALLGRCARPCRPFGDCRLRPDGGRQGTRRQRLSTGITASLPCQDSPLTLFLPLATVLRS